MDDKIFPIPLSIDVTYSLLERIEKAARRQRISIETFINLAVIGRVVEIERSMREEE